MLGKLLKYDLRYIYKVLGAYYLISISSVALGALLSKIEHPPYIIDFIEGFLTNAGFGLSIGLMITAFTRTWMRFRQSLYGDESYLTHTLPVSRLQLFTSKFICAIIVLLLSLAVAALVLLLYVSSFSNFDIGAFFADLSVTIADTSFTLFCLIIILGLLVIVQSIFIIMCGFSGIIIGRRFNTAPGPISSITGLGCYLIAGGLLIGIIYLFSTFDPELAAVFTHGHQPNLPTIINCAWICIATYTIATATLFVVNVNLLNRGVNVE